MLFSILILVFLILQIVAVTAQGDDRSSSSSTTSSAKDKDDMEMEDYASVASSFISKSAEKEYTLGKKLGSGSYGGVYLGEKNHTKVNNELAIRDFNLRNSAFLQFPQ